QRGDTQDHHAHGGRDDQVPEPQAGADHRPHQGPPGWLRGGYPLRSYPGLAIAHSSPLMLYSVPSSSAAPTVTTCVPAGGPADSCATAPSISVTVIGLRW